MHHISKMLSITLLLSFPCKGQDAIPIDDPISRQVAGDFMGGDFSTSYPVGFPELNFPDGLEVIGSLDRGETKEVVLSSTLSDAELDSLIFQGLPSRNWLLLSDEVETQTSNGFVSATSLGLRSLSSITFCHNQLGYLVVNGRRIGASKRINLVWRREYPPLDARQNCAEQNQQRISGFSPGEARSNQEDLAGLVVPRLELPFDPDRPNLNQNPGSAISRKGRDEVEIRTTMVSSWSNRDIYQHFAAQLRDQGWTMDSDWNGEATAGGSWTKTTAENFRLVGVFFMVKTDRENFDLQFRIIVVR